MSMGSQSCPSGPSIGFSGSVCQPLSSEESAILKVRVHVELIGFSFSFSAIPADHYLLSNMNIYHYIQSEQYTPLPIPNPLQFWFSSQFVPSGFTSPLLH